MFERYSPNANVAECAFALSATTPMINAIQELPVPRSCGPRNPRVAESYFGSPRRSLGDMKLERAATEKNSWLRRSISTSDPPAAKPVPILDEGTS
jgi:hypothetical protein